MKPSYLCCIVQGSQGKYGTDYQMSLLLAVSQKNFAFVNAADTM